jgi:hypothetical protein
LATTTPLTGTSSSLGRSTSGRFTHTSSSAAAFTAESSAAAALSALTPECFSSSSDEEEEEEPSSMPAKTTCLRPPGDTPGVRRSELMDLALQKKFKEIVSRADNFVSGS